MSRPTKKGLKKSYPNRRQKLPNLSLQLPFKFLQRNLPIEVSLSGPNEIWSACLLRVNPPKKVSGNSAQKDSVNQQFWFET